VPASNPTGASKENKVLKVEGSEPWNTGNHAPYQYHPYGDTSEKKDAPSPLHISIIPNVNLPKVPYLKAWNAYLTDSRTSMIGLTSTEKTVILK